jgi:N-acyl-L-homoserine lactone synthetase
VETIMQPDALLNAIAVAKNNFTIEIADTPDLRREALRLRHQVYCVERGFEPAIGGEESDGFDAFAAHALLRHNDSGEVVGTVRVVGANPRKPDRGFPMQAAIDPTLLAGLPLITTGEVSRFALSKQRRADCNAAGLMRLALLRGVLMMSTEMGLTHWCAVMGRPLLRLLAGSGIHFHAVGPLVGFHGLRQPSVANIPALVHRLRREQPLVWDYLTAGGTLDRSMASPRRDGPPARRAPLIRATSIDPAGWDMEREQAGRRGGLAALMDQDISMPPVHAAIVPLGAGRGAQ